jgi:hypothetical protein
MILHELHQSGKTPCDRGRRFISFVALILILVEQVVLIPSRDAAAVPLMLMLTGLGIILFIAFVVCFYKLGVIPRILNGDEGWLGVNAYSLRLLPAIGGTLAIPAIYLLGRQISNHRIGLIAAILLAFSQTHIHFSRTAAVAYIHST